MAYEERTGRVHERLANAPALPAGCDLLWSDFLELHECRGSNGFAPSRISFADIDAWQRVQGIRLPAWRIAAIRAADSAFLAHHAEVKRD